MLTYEHAKTCPGDAFPKRLILFKNGLILRPQKAGQTSGHDYAVTNNAVTFVQAPQSATVIQAIHEVVPEA